MIGRRSGMSAAVAAFVAPDAVAAMVRDDASRRGRSSKRKGKVWERELAKLLRAVFGEHVKRGFQSRSGRDGCDVEGTPLWIEAKHGKCVNLRAAMAQALAATDGRPPVVVAKDDRSAPLVVMRLSDWLDREREVMAALRRVVQREEG